jgi:type IV pilus assembly protein PilB
MPKRVDLSKIHFTRELLKCVPAIATRKYQTLPIAEPGPALPIVLAEPLDMQVIDELHFILKHDLEIFSADARQIQRLVAQFYGERN